jgi:hypothetical protein
LFPIKFKRRRPVGLNSKLKSQIQIAYLSVCCAYCRATPYCSGLKFKLKSQVQTQIAYCSLLRMLYCRDLCRLVFLVLRTTTIVKASFSYIKAKIGNNKSFYSKNKSAGGSCGIWALNKLDA